jgi:hypothetical protein
VSVETHDGIEIIEISAFDGCRSLRGIKLPGIRELENAAFYDCSDLSDVEFGNKLETIGTSALSYSSLATIKMPTVRTIEHYAFDSCEDLTGVELPAVERIDIGAFDDCFRLQRIAIPLKDNLFSLDSRQQ